MDVPVQQNQALAIAAADAAAAYGDLAPYEVKIRLEGGRVWRVDYELKDRQAQGGGPHYEISAATGEILAKRYEQ